MTTILFIHSAGPQGQGEGSSRLLAALQEVIPSGMTLVAPMMPEPDAPKAAAWIASCCDHLRQIEDDVVVVGHSLGGSTMLQVLAEHGVPNRLLGVVLVAAPFWSAKDWNVAEFALPQGAEAELNKIRKLIILQGDRDEVVPTDHPNRYRALLPGAEILTMPGVDHEAADAAPAVIAAVHTVVSAKS